MSVTGTRVFGHPQVVEYQAYVTRESSHFLRHAPSAFGFEHADGETTKPSEIFRTVVIIVPIDHVVATLDGPVAAVDPQNALRSGLFRRAAGEDRKSTRLNSSHTVISYAVFCLKKKKKKYTRQE